LAPNDERQIVQAKIDDDAIVETIVRAKECHDKSREVGHE